MQRAMLSHSTRHTSYGAGQAWRRRAHSGSAGAHMYNLPNALAMPSGFAFQAQDGLTYTLRRVRAADARLLAEFLPRLSSQTRLMRYMSARPCTPEFVRAEVSRMAAGATGDSYTLLVMDAGGRANSVAAVAELVYDRERGACDVALVVVDNAQRKGIGSLLLRQLLEIARELGLATMHGDMFAENYAMQHLIQSLEVPYTARIQAGEMHIVVSVPTWDY